MELIPDLLRPESTVQQDRYLGEEDARAPDQNDQSITPADRPDAEPHFIIAKGDRVIEPQPPRVALEWGLLWILAASLAAHGLVLLFLAWFSHAPLEADRLKETPVEVVVETPMPPKPPENGASAPPAQKAKPNSGPEAKTTGANPPDSRPPQANRLETKPPASNAAEARPPASDPPEAKPEKAKAAPSRAADQNGAGQKQRESRRAERKPPPAQAKASAFARAAAQNQAAAANATKIAAAREVMGTRAADQWSDVGAQSGGVRLPFDTGPDIFRAVAVPLPVEGGDEPLSYKEIVFGLLERAKQYPQTARERGARGSAVVSFVLDDAGELTDVSLVRSSGEADLDAESLALVARAAPFPKPPLGAQRAFAAEITFGLQKAD
jgi:periplasmic protein TonB